ncbi:MAG: alpha/beta hydrolase [Gammaproteobacteria bacterium]|nr:alpha/beta hydrolase [Gammaproteobacteria bacterium]
MNEFAWQQGKNLRLELGDLSLEARCYGPPPAQSPTLVLLHEGLGCVALWRQFPELLSSRTGLGVFAYSRAGYGQSSAIPLPRPLDYMTREAVDVLPQVLERIGFRNGVLIGHSDGASIAAIYAGRVVDERLQGLVLMAPHFFTEPDQLMAIESAKVAYLESDLRDKLSRYHANVDIAFRGWNDAWLDRDFKRWNISDVIDSWSVPALVIQGADDEYGTLAQVQEIQRRSRRPVTVDIVQQCRHAPHLEYTEHTLAGIDAFLRALPS